MRIVLIFHRSFIFLIHSLVMRKTNSEMIFLMQFTLTLYRDFYVMSDKSSGRRTTHKSRWWTGVIFLCGICIFRSACGRFRIPKNRQSADEKICQQKWRRSLFWIRANSDQGTTRPSCKNCHFLSFYPNSNPNPKPKHAKTDRFCTWAELSPGPS